MSCCVANPKKFWFFRWLGPHEKRMVYISRFGSFSWGKYTVSYSCNRCGVTLEDRVATESDLVCIGFDVDRLHKLDRFGEHPKNLLRDGVNL